MNQIISSLLQPSNNTEMQKKSSNTPENKESNFSDIFNNAIEEPSNKVSPKDRPSHDSTNNSKKMVPASNNKIETDKMSNVKNSDFELSKTVSAKEFLEKLGLDEDTIQNILQANGLSENATLLELLKNFDFTLDNLDNFLKTPAIDFLSQLGLEDEKITAITEGITGQIENVDENVISVKNLFENVGLKSEKQTTVEVKDLPEEIGNLSANDFLRKLGLNEREVSNLTKELTADKSLNDKAAFNIKETDAKGLLKQMGLSSDEITKILEANIENSTHKNKIKNLVLNKDFSALKNMASSEKPDPQGMFQSVSKNSVPGAFTARVQSEIALPTNPVIDSSTVSSIQSSGSMNGSNVGSGTNGYTQMANISNEIPTDSRLQETTPKAFFERTVIDQIISKVSFKVTGGREEIKIKLDPPSLGSLQMKISVDGKLVSATIVADNNIAKEIIQSNIQQLKDSMAEQGLKLDNISVSVGDGHSGDKDMDEFRMLAKENMGQNPELENDNIHNIEEDSGIYYRNGYALSQSGVDLFI